MMFKILDLINMICVCGFLFKFLLWMIFEFCVEFGFEVNLIVYGRMFYYSVKWGFKI